MEDAEYEEVDEVEEESPRDLDEDDDDAIEKTALSKILQVYSMCATVSIVCVSL